MKNLVLLLLIGYGIYYYLGQPEEVAAPAPALFNANGFVRLPPHIDGEPGAVYVMAALNCTKDAAQRADDLAFQLQRRGLVVRRVSRVSFDLPPVSSREEAEQRQQRMDAVMKGTLPIVLFNGMGRANPDLQSVLDEINRQRG